jgi:putative transposase
VYAAVEAIVQNDVQQTSAVCEGLGVSRGAYYAWSTREASAHEDRDAELSPLVRDIFWKHHRRYGARRIVAQLAEQGESCGTRRVAKLLENQGLSAIQPKSLVPKTTDSRHTLGYSPNLLLDMPELTAINQLLVGDITYVPLADGTFCYLATRMDRTFTRSRRRLKNKYQLPSHGSDPNVERTSPPRPSKLFRKSVAGTCKKMRVL